MNLQLKQLPVLASVHNRRLWQWMALFSVMSIRSD